MYIYKPTVSSGGGCFPLDFSLVFLQLPEFFTEDFRLFLSTSADSGAGAGSEPTRLKAENRGGWKAEWREEVNSWWLCRENLWIISGPLTRDNDRLRSVSAESRTKLTSSPFIISSWLFRSISLSLSVSLWSLKSRRARPSCFLLGVWAGTRVVTWGNVNTVMVCDGQYNIVI